MREIKFSAWDSENKKMYKNCFRLEIHGTTISNQFDVNSSENLIWLQYTGLKDKNGKDIFEGDIIELENCYGDKIMCVCKFGSVQREIMGNFLNLCEITGFYFEFKTLSTFPIVKNYKGIHDLELFEIIGNIHENLELL